MTPAVTHPSNAAWRPVAGAATVADVVVKWSARPGAFALESVCDTSGYGRISLLGCTPIHRLELDVCATDPQTLWRRLADACPVSAHAAAPEARFAGGWVGYLPYEAGARLHGVDPVMATNETSPRLRLALYDTVAIFDHQAGQWRVAGCETPLSRAPLEVRLDQLAEDILQAEGAATAFDLHAPMPATADPSLASNLSRADYLRRVERAQAYIAAGDIYQVNLTQRFRTPTVLSPLELYLRLRATNPADFAAFLPWGEDAIISSSPELFLDVTTGGRVITRPIKGTRKRTDQPGDDLAGAAALRASDKDRAELNMIIDLLRNDLGQVCEFGTVQVMEDSAVEVHPTVLHLVATIVGQLRPEVSHVELLRAAFPGGSITGCPKIRAMQIITELEPTPRDVYCGSIGWIGLDGHMMMNIAIRTMRYQSGILDIHAGGAITADSDPAAEYAESLAKAEGMFRAVGYSTERLPHAKTMGREAQPVAPPGPQQVDAAAPPRPLDA